MVTINKQSIVDKYNTFFSSNKVWKDLSNEEKLLITQILEIENSGSGGGSVTGSVKIIDSENDELKISSTGKISVDASGSIVPVSGTFWQSTQPVSLSTLPSLATGSNVIGSISNTGFNSTQSGTWSVRNQDGNGNAITSQVSGTQRPLDAALIFSGNVIDPRSIRALTSSDIVSSAQSGVWNINNISGTISLPTGASTETTLSAISNKLPTSLVSGRLSVDGSGVTQPVSISTLPSLATGSNTIGSISNISGTISLPTGASTSALQTTGNNSLSSIDTKTAGFGTAGTPSANVISIQGVSGMTSLSINQISNVTTANITFTSSTTSSTFTITNRLAIIVCPTITGAPTLTLQISLDSGTTWVNTSVTLSTNASSATIIESDSLARVSGAFGLSNGFRFSSTASITSATLNLRSIVQ